MNTFTFTVRRGVSTHLLTVCDTSEQRALKQAQLIEPEHAIIDHAEHIQPGTLEDHLGEESMERIARKYRTNRSVTQKKSDRARRKAIEKAAAGGKT